MKKAQKQCGQAGNSRLIVLLTVPIVGILGGLGAYVWQVKKPVPLPAPAPVTEVTPQTAASERFKEMPKPTVSLDEWDVVFTLPSSLSSKAVYKFDAKVGRYVFSTKAITEDQKCVDYFKTERKAEPGLEVWRHDEKTAAASLIGTVKTTEARTKTGENLTTYYQKYKDKSGTFFADPANTNRRYYKVGQHFYVILVDTADQIATDSTAFKASCRNEQPDYHTAFLEAFTSLRLE